MHYITLDLSRGEKARAKSTKWCSATHFRQRRCTLFQARCFLFGNSKFPRCCQSCELESEIIVSDFFVYQFLNLCIRSQTSQVQLSIQAKHINTNLCTNFSIPFKNRQRNQRKHFNWWPFANIQSNRWLIIYLWNL